MLAFLMSFHPLHKNKRKLMGLFFEKNKKLSFLLKREDDGRFIGFLISPFPSPIKGTKVIDYRIDASEGESSDSR